MNPQPNPGEEAKATTAIDVLITQLRLNGGITCQWAIEMLSSLTTERDRLAAEVERLTKDYEKRIDNLVDTGQRLQAMLEGGDVANGLLQEERSRLTSELEAAKLRHEVTAEELKDRTNAHAITFQELESAKVAMGKDRSEMYAAGLGLTKELEAAKREREMFKIENESRVIWIEKMSKILGHDNSDGFHSDPCPHTIAERLVSQRDALAAKVRELRESLEKCHPAHIWDYVRAYYSAGEQVNSPTIRHHENLCKLVDSLLSTLPPDEGKEKGKGKVHYTISRDGGRTGIFWSDDLDKCLDKLASVPAWHSDFSVVAVRKPTSAPKEEQPVPSTSNPATGQSESDTGNGCPKCGHWTATNSVTDLTFCPKCNRSFVYRPIPPTEGGGK
jgi:hypothetical protein